MSIFVIGHNMFIFVIGHYMPYDKDEHIMPYDKDGHVMPYDKDEHVMPYDSDNENTPDDSDNDQMPTGIEKAKEKGQKDKIDINDIGIFEFIFRGLPEPPELEGVDEDRLRELQKCHTRAIMPKR